MKIIPEHIIVSCDVERDGNRNVTLRSQPGKIGGPFQFMTVVGGLKAHPWLDTYPNWWEIEGTAVTKHLVNRYRVAYEETFFTITGHRKLTRAECKKHSKGVEKFWEDDSHYDTSSDNEEEA